MLGVFICGSLELNVLVVFGVVGAGFGVGEPLTLYE